MPPPPPPPKKMNKIIGYTHSTPQGLVIKIWDGVEWPLSAYRVKGEMPRFKSKRMAYNRLIFVTETQNTSLRKPEGFTSIQDNDLKGI